MSNSGHIKYRKPSLSVLIHVNKRSSLPTPIKYEFIRTLWAIWYVHRFGNCPYRTFIISIKTNGHYTWFSVICRYTKTISTDTEDFNDKTYSAERPNCNCMGELRLLKYTTPCNINKRKLTTFTFSGYKSSSSDWQ